MPLLPSSISGDTLSQGGGYQVRLGAYEGLCHGVGPDLKFAQHKDLFPKLIDTGDAVLIEDSPSR